MPVAMVAYALQVTSVSINIMATKITNMLMIKVAPKEGGCGAAAPPNHPKLKIKK
jgi:hypothetical protein